MSESGPDSKIRQGRVITFYSFKGGVGRSMALANIAVLLAKMGKRVLMVDWDLEAPGLHRYFREDADDPTSVIVTKALLPDGLMGCLQQAQDTSSFNWSDRLISITLPERENLSLLPSGWGSEHYSRTFAEFSWNAFYRDHDGGDLIEKLRAEWINEYDFVLVDSRTGVTDASGVCTIQLPDTMVLVVAANEQNLAGSLSVAQAAREARQEMPYDRPRLLIAPLLSRFDETEEHKEAKRWKQRFVNTFRTFFNDWLPTDVDALVAVERTRIPYAAYFSFGEKLPVLSDGVTNPQSIGYYFNVMARLLDGRFQNVESVLTPEKPGLQPWQTAETPYLTESRNLQESSATPNTSDAEVEDLPAGQPSKSRISSQRNFSWNWFRKALSPSKRNRGSTRPVIYVSAVSGELRTARDLVAKTLLALGYEIKWQDIFATDAGDLRGVLRKLVDDSDAVLQLVGHCYGFGPPTPDPDFGPCSYTQYETLYARQQGKPVYYFFMDGAHPTDGCRCEPKTLHDLQAQYRQTVKGFGDLYYRTSSLTQTELLVRRLQDGLAKLRAELQMQQISLVRKVAIVLLIGLVLVPGIVWMVRTLSAQQDAATATSKQVDLLQAQNDKLLQALRDLPQTLSQQAHGDAKEDETTRLARAYATLEAQMKLHKGTLEKELPQFAEQLLARADTSTLDRANALFATKQFAAAEAAALQAKDQALVAAGKPVQDAIEALRYAGQSAEAQIHYAQAMEHYQKASALTSPDREIIQWLQIQNEISNLYYLQGLYPEGLAHAEAVWQTAHQAKKDDDPAVLEAHTRYAAALLAMGRAAEAEAEQRSVLKLQERSQGIENPDTLKSRNNLGLALGAQGKNAEAEEEYRAVLKVRERVLGAEDPDTLKSRGNLAEALQAQGKNAEAEEEYRAVLKVMERVLGAEHPDTLSSRGNLAAALGAQGKNAEAEQEQRAVLQVMERVLGAEHPDTLKSRNNLANALQAQGKNAEAEQEYRAVIQIKERVLGAEHPDVAQSCYDLALCLEDQKKLPEALTFMQRAERLWTKALGHDHPHTKLAKTERERLDAVLAQQRADQRPKKPDEAAN